jgi:regulator of nucleoside diphosphate kinase
MLKKKLPGLLKDGPFLFKDDRLTDIMFSENSEEAKIMRNRTIYVTKDDAEKLRKLLETTKVFYDQDRDDLQELEAELEQGNVIDSGDIPQDVIIMNSKVRLLDLDTEEEVVYRLVFPENMDIDQDKISVLAPVGTAMLGRRVGDVFEGKVPAGLCRLKVEAILHQPEL